MENGDQASAPAPRDQEPVLIAVEGPGRRPAGSLTASAVSSAALIPRHCAPPCYIVENTESILSVS